MGRNLAVTALQSEPAVQMARRGRPEAVDQMVEVQHLAHDGRNVAGGGVRGSREADPRVALMGAVRMLESAGGRCTVIGADQPELPAPVRSALGRVVRETTTDVALEEPSGDDGSGRCGLRERLGALEGTLRTEFREPATFRPTADVPSAEVSA